MRDFDNLAKTVNDPTFKKYIYYARSIARRYKIPNHASLDFEDLYQELQITLLKCCEVVNDPNSNLNKVSDEQKRADDIRNYVCQAIRNRADSLFRFSRVQKRDGIQVELGPEFDNVHSNAFDEMHMNIMQQQMRDILSGLSLQVFNLIMNPNKELLESCERSSARKAHLKKSNAKIRGAECVRVYKWNIMDTLNIQPGDFRSALNQIHSAYDAVVGVTV